MLKTLAVLFLSCLLCIYGCTKVKIPKETTLLHAEVKHVVWDTGSWWAYKSIDNGSIDTIIVTDVKKGTARYVTEKQGYNFEYYKVGFKNISTGQVYADYYYNNCIKRNCTETNIAETGQEIFFPEDYNPEPQGRDHGCYFDEPVPYVTHNGMVFTRVRTFEIVMQYQIQPPLFPYGCIYEYSPDAGFIFYNMSWGYYKILGYHVNRVL